MTKPSRILIACVALAGVASPMAHAAPGQASATYVATAGIRFDLSEQGQPYGYGGYEFTPTGDPTQLRVDDVNGGGVTWYLCQEGPGEEGETPLTCGDGDDVVDSKCSTGGFQPVAELLRPNTPVAVFIFMRNSPQIWAGAECEGVGVGGTVTLKWA